MTSTWQQFDRQLVRYTDLGIHLDYSLMGSPDDFLERFEERCAEAYREMAALEAGEEKNPEEGRRVGHYWLRAGEEAPDFKDQEADEGTIRQYVTETCARIRQFASEIHASGAYTHLLVVGIGGSALGPQLVADALGSSEDKLAVAFLDNTDPDGFARVLGGLPLGKTLTLVISKSGGTKETANGMHAAAEAYQEAGVAFAEHAVAVTGVGSLLDKKAEGEGWKARFPMTDWVGGRTSVTSVVGLLPMALQGLDIDAFLEGARLMDLHTRSTFTPNNAAMLMALMWHHAGEGKGSKDMVILPYKDRLALMAKYLQQLIMESLGKEHDLEGNVVEQGIAVYGNKGSTDQHAYVQQLRDGVNNFFATFIEVRRQFTDGSQHQDTAGDYLQGFLRGTRKALAEKGRPSMTISLPQIDATSLGALIALYERAVGYYAFLIGINAYHQPGVEAGKKAAEAFLDFMNQAREQLRESGRALTAAEVLPHVKSHETPKGEPQAPTVEDVYHALNHIAHNDGNVTLILGDSPDKDTFQFGG